MQDKSEIHVVDFMELLIQNIWKQNIILEDDYF